MADATIPILGGGTTSVPQDYVVKGGQVLGLAAVRAQFDGSGAGGSFLPCVQIVSAAGNVMSQTLSESVAAGSSADVTFHPFRKPAPAAAAAASALPWCEAFQANYGGADFHVGRSPFPLNYRSFAGNDPTAFAFNNTNTPTAGDGEVRILRSGYYRVRLIVSALFATGVGPGYNWDLAVQIIVQDAFTNQYFGPGPAAGNTYYSEGSYAFYFSPGPPAFGGPNWPSLQGYPAPDPAGDVYLNLPAAPIAFPVTIWNRFNHGLNDADVFGPWPYYLQVIRMGDADASGFVG